MVSGAVIALVCAVLAFGLWRLLRRLIRNQSSHTGLGHTAPAVVPQAVPEPVVLADQRNLQAVEALALLLLSNLSLLLLLRWQRNLLLLRG